MAPHRCSGPCSRRDGVIARTAHAGAVAASCGLARFAKHNGIGYRSSRSDRRRSDEVSRMETKGPRFVRYFGPVIEVLKGLGGSGSPEEVRAEVASRLAISENEQAEQLASGSSRFDNQVAWARFYLTRARLLDSSRRGVWTLTEKGRATTLSEAAAVQLFKDIHKVFSAERKARPKEGPLRMIRSKSPRLRPQPENRVQRITGRRCLGPQVASPRGLRKALPAASSGVRLPARHSHGPLR
jgi:hypothetical protein